MNSSSTTWGDWQPGTESGWYRHEFDVQGNVIQTQHTTSDGSAPRQPGGQQQQQHQVDDLADAITQLTVHQSTRFGPSSEYAGAQAGTTGPTGYEQCSDYGGSPQYTFSTPAQARVDVGISHIPVVVNGSNPPMPNLKITGAEPTSRSSKAKSRGGGGGSGSSKDKDRSSKSSRKDRSGLPHKEKHSSFSSSKKHVSSSSSLSSRINAVPQQAVSSPTNGVQYGDDPVPESSKPPVPGPREGQGPFGLGVVNTAMAEEDIEDDGNDKDEEEEEPDKLRDDSSPEAALVRSPVAAGQGGAGPGAPQDPRRPPGSSGGAWLQQARYLSHEEAAAMVATAGTGVGGVGGVGPTTGHQEQAHVPRSSSAYYNTAGSITSSTAGTATTLNYTMSAAPVASGGAGMGGVPMAPSASMRSLGSTYSGAGPSVYGGSLAPGPLYGSDLDLSQQSQPQPQTPGWDMLSPASPTAFVMDSRYVVEKSTRFMPGEVFKIYWAEPFGGGNATPAGGSRPHTPMIAEEGVRAVDRFFYGFRRFIVIAMDEGHSTCIPILTYGTRGCNKPGVKPRKHGIVYHHGPAAPIAGEPALGVAPVRVHLEVDSERLAAESRVNYSKLQTIEHNAPVFFIGYVDARDFEAVVKPAVQRFWAAKRRDQVWAGELQHRRLIREQQLTQKQELQQHQQQLQHQHQHQHQQQQQQYHQQHQQQQQQHQQQQYGQGGYMYTPR